MSEGLKWDVSIELLPSGLREHCSKRDRNIVRARRISPKNKAF